jgi:hypothetical protein
MNIENNNYNDNHLKFLGKVIPKSVLINKGPNSKLLKEYKESLSDLSKIQ